MSDVRFTALLTLGSKASPPPWTALVNPDGDLILVFAKPNDAYAQDILFGDVELISDQDHANAHLAAAAHELLAEVDRLRAALAHTHQTLDPND
jgi:hypothetical protein